jgi:hypothetical protein
MPADVDEAAVFDSGRARRLAAPAREAAVEVQPRLAADFSALEHLFHEVNAPARAVQLVAQQQIRGARCRAKPAMHAGAQDRIGFPALVRVTDEVGERGLHR